VVELLAAKRPYDAFTQLQKLGEVREVKNVASLFERTADDYVQTVANGKSCLVISPVRSEIEQFTASVRAKLKDQGMLAREERETTVTSSYGWTEAQRKRPENYKPGDVLQFHRQTSAFQKGETVKVVETRGERVVVERSNGDRYAFDPRRVHSFDVSEARKIPVATGERLLIQGNLKTSRLKNGEVVAVAGFEADGAIRLQDGRFLPPSFCQYTHGYATTSHAAQGRTVDRGLLIMGDAAIRAANLPQAYVSNSRFRERQTIYTTDFKAAKNAMANDLDRKLAHELREKRARQWRVVERLVSEGQAWRAHRRRVVAATEGETTALRPGGLRHAA
jgi:hypothetical protein